MLVDRASWLCNCSSSLCMHLRTCQAIEARDCINLHAPLAHTVSLMVLVLIVLKGLRPPLGQLQPNPASVLLSLCEPAYTATLSTWSCATSIDKAVRSVCCTVLRAMVGSTLAGGIARGGRPARHDLTT